MATIITRLRDPYDLELVLYRDESGYGVASVSSHRRLIRLAAPDRFATYGEAHDRMEQAWRERHGALNPQGA